MRRRRQLLLLLELFVPLIVLRPMLTRDGEVARRFNSVGRLRRALPLMRLSRDGEVSGCLDAMRRGRLLQLLLLLSLLLLGRLLAPPLRLLRLLLLHCRGRRWSGRRPRLLGVLGPVAAVMAPLLRPRHFRELDGPFGPLPLIGSLPRVRAEAQIRLGAGPSPVAGGVSLP